ncbi:hypothetical protein FDP41_010361 [Naegleria fowleri]|uniref:Uncharacterized protein n=1 Tax=Naegleria fowleri TaxID=5763 RepID=A0A6A5C6C0_NAEFO|nr:uncharacterized protein FDP41_010361 [Naegleria fowleri]KAF0983296.1 hypothetical protein FDP41_010361 [Naegleria fowleri]
MKPTSSSSNNNNNTNNNSSSNNAPISYPELLNILNAEHQSSMLLHESSNNNGTNDSQSILLPSSSNAANHLFHSLFASHHPTTTPTTTTTNTPTTPSHHSHHSLSTTQLLLDELTQQQQQVSPLFHTLPSGAAAASAALVDPYLSIRLFQLGQQQRVAAALMNSSPTTSTPTTASLFDPTTAAAAVLLQQQQQQQQQALLNSVALAQQLTSSLMMKSVATHRANNEKKPSFESGSNIQKNEPMNTTTTSQSSSSSSSSGGGEKRTNNTLSSNNISEMKTIDKMSSMDTSVVNPTIVGSGDHDLTMTPLLDSSLPTTTNTPANMNNQTEEDSRHWSIAFVNSQILLNSQVNIYLETRDSGPRLESIVDSELYSSIKYEMRHEIKELVFNNGEESDDLQLFCRIQIIHPDNKTEVLKNGKPILGGVIESNVSRQSDNSNMTSMKIKFTDCSYHHGNCKFAFRVSYFIESDLDNPILIMESAPFKVLARKPSKNKKPAQKRKKEEEEENIAVTVADSCPQPPPSQKIKISNFEDFKQVTASVFDYIQSANDEQKKRQMINHVVTKLYSVDPNIMFSLPSDDGANDIFKGLL